MPAQVEAWIQDLASERFEVRELARQGLERWARQAPEVLRRHADAEDPEVRRTVRALLERLGTAVQDVSPVSADLSEVGRVSVDAAERPLGELLAELEATFGGAVVLPAEARARPVTLRLAAMPYFQALEALLAAADLVAPGPFDAEGRLTAQPPTPVPAPVPRASAGPVRVRALKIAVTRPLDASGPALHALTLELQLAPCVQLAAYRMPRVLEARDAAGGRWRAPAGEPAVLYGVGGDPRRVELQVTLTPAEEPAPAAEGVERLARLDLALPLRLRHERHEVAFAHPGPLPRTLDQGGAAAAEGGKGTLTLHRLEPAEGRADAWLADLSCVFAGGVARESVEAWLLQADGQRRRLWIAGGRSTTSADGRLRLVGRAHGVGTEPPKGLTLVWFERDVDGELPLTLLDVPLR